MPVYIIERRTPLCSNIDPLYAQKCHVDANSVPYLVGKDTLMMTCKVQFALLVPVP